MKRKFKLNYFFFFWLWNNHILNTPKGLESSIGLFKEINKLKPNYYLVYEGITTPSSHNLADE